MTYYSRVLRTFIPLAVITLIATAVFYFVINSAGLQSDTAISAVLIVIILSFIIPLVSDSYQKKEISAGSVHSNWRSIIRREFLRSHRIIENDQETLLLVKREHPLLSWFYLGRRNTWIITSRSTIALYGPAETTSRIIALIFD